MTRSRPSTAPAATAPPPGLERLGLPWWAWPPGLFAGALVGVEANMGLPAVPFWIPYVIVMPLAVVVLWWLGRMRVGVGPGPDGEREFWAGPAHIPTRFIGRTDVVRGEDKRMALGPQLDPAAHVLLRPWVAPAVRLEITDPDDPTPYWVVSTRRPDRLLAAIRGEH
ncbi:DUF3093 domain-containing protein [Actinomycetospora endophytica]|uniref:DUF3093 domain-containing protein n=1 Tax=Actinomycetospora endophytica TaxID=2291215 RepID=A0ABS8PF04_9PSEU|nr:DUF3093 domain-containing protein [Actinomycetospora endophytica]MCD2196845.1 DUF3093 domain-containing protein [Actinomycetospora endophytica]